MQNPFKDARPILQDLAESVMEDTATVKVPGGRVDKPGGGWEYTTEATTTFPCRIGPLSEESVERAREGRLEFTGLEELRAPTTAPLSAKSTVTVVSARFGTSRRYTIEGVAPLGTYSVQKIAIVKHTG